MTDYVGIAVKRVNEVETVGIDWTAWLAKTADTIVDCEVVEGGLQVRQRWFTDNSTSIKVGGGSKGSNDLVVRVFTEANEVYERTINVRNR